MIPQHSSESVEHPTPAEVVRAARITLGTIDLDPASTPALNQSIKAGRIYTVVEDGLRREWFGRVFLNPPGGRLRARDLPNNEGRIWEPVKGGRAESSAKIWWEYLVAEWSAGRVKSAIFVSFTLELLRTSQQSPLPIQRFPRCYPRDRLCFKGNDPTHANVLVYIPPMLDIASDHITFFHAFERLGFCEKGAQ